MILGITGPFYTNHSFSIVATLLNRVILQAILFFVFLTLSLQAGSFISAAVGFGLFISFRWGIVSKILDPVLSKLKSWIYNIPYEDKVLRSLIIKKSMKYRTPLAEVNEIELSLMRKIVDR